MKPQEERQSALPGLDRKLFALTDKQAVTWSRRGGGAAMGRLYWRRQAHLAITERGAMEATIQHLDLILYHVVRDSSPRGYKVLTFVTPVLPADVLVEDYGSIVMLQPRTKPALRWMHRHLPDAVWLDGRVATEHRCVEEIVQALAGHAFRVGAG